MASDQVVYRKKKDEEDEEQEDGLWLKEVSVVQRPNNWIIIVWGVRGGAQGAEPASSEESCHSTSCH